MLDEELDPRVRRSRAAAVSAARSLFLQQGYGGTTMEDIAELAGLTKRTLYNNYRDKASLFEEIVSEVTAFAAAFARELPSALASVENAVDLSGRMTELAQRLALAIARPDVIALRRLLISETRTFPALANHYFDRAPQQVIRSLASEFARLRSIGLLAADDERLAASQFAYLVVGESLDRAMLTGTLPVETEVIRYAREGAVTFMARFVPSAHRQV